MILALGLIFGLVWSVSRQRQSGRQSRGTFDVFDPVNGVLPGQRQLSGQTLGRWSRDSNCDNFSIFLIQPKGVRIC
jgi:hypothetical protein